ncbi:hypothetical protein [uncultured Campylobacter sp.]|uniref:hypothetical protein n=1 Tax=uncultured Campylobacter sp. TaxID=218934 RepID=UPI002612FAEA|nr:hypothetical protein [uncultured Campylobacter sp.]
MFNFKIYLGIIGALILACLALVGWNHNLKGKIEQLNKDLVFAKTQEIISSSNLQACNAKIDLQNAKFEEIALQNEKLKAAEPIIKKEIETRYKPINVPIRDAKCEKKLKFYEEIFREMGR